jgi:hypothetical protein
MQHRSVSRSTTNLAYLRSKCRDIAANVQWPGAVIDLRTDRASPEIVRSAARQILDSSFDRDRAGELAESRVLLRHIS